ncbi:hypothetical protein [Lentzea jiangxiensis]|uniref:hypothetical protein n=1 Tax=Lentzea jiangxiensis TaxID=641025 RepID=UPI000B7DEAF4|nr:hypothetical protein [Lentzea jiangxiensis]
MDDQRSRPHILLAPCYGNSKTRRRYHQTIEAGVEFESREYAELLAPADLTALRALHPSGAARFWGAIATHDKTMNKLRTGDVVVFTGGNRVKAAGEIGHLFRNPPLADLMWDQFDDERSFVNIYSVRNVQVIERPRREVWRNLGFDEGDNVAGQRLVTGERVERMLAELRIVPSLAQALIGAQLEAVDRALATGSHIIPVETFHTDSVSLHITERITRHERVESRLVCRYQQFRSNVVFTSFRTHNGKRADLYRVEDDEVEILEAKSLAIHEKVREAAGQLLDYAAESPHPVTRLSALFPLRPDQYSVDFLHRLGIDCVYRSGDGAFIREEAPEERRRYMLVVWRGKG